MKDNGDLKVTEKRGRWVNINVKLKIIVICECPAGLIELSTRTSCDTKLKCIVVGISCELFCFVLNYFYQLL